MARSALRPHQVTNLGSNEYHPKANPAVRGLLGWQTGLEDIRSFRPLSVLRLR